MKEKKERIEEIGKILGHPIKRSILEIVALNGRMTHDEICIYLDISAKRGLTHIISLMKLKLLVQDTDSNKLVLNKTQYFRAKRLFSIGI